MIKRSILKTLTLSIILLLLCNNIVHTVYAQFPERNGDIIVDPTQRLDVIERNGLKESLSDLPHDYVVVFLDELNEDGFDYATKLFDYYGLGSSEFLVIALLGNDSQLYYAYGNQFVDEGLTDDEVNSKIDSFYTSYVRQGKHISGVTNFIRAIERELENLQAQRAREASIVVSNDGIDEEMTEVEKSLPWWIKGLIVGFILLVLVMILSFFIRRSIIKQVDLLESWKIQLENRPFTAELARVKGLKMAGETEARFEKWKAEWEDILTTTLPNIEETLIDIEDYAHGYRFYKAKELLAQTKERFVEIERSLDQIVEEIDELTSSEKNNRHKVAELHEEYQKLKSDLQKNSLSLGVSYPVWYERFKKVSGWFEDFTNAQENGDYLSANDMLEAIDEVFSQIKEAIEHIPSLVQEVEIRIPQLMMEVDQALAEMKEKGYVFEHTSIEQRALELKKKREVVSYLENGQIKETQAWVDSVLKEVDALFTLLEEEVESRAFVKRNIQVLPELMEQLTPRFQQVVEEVAVTKQSYSWETEWEEELAQMRKLFDDITIFYQEFQAQQQTVLEQSYYSIKPKLVLFLEKRELLDVKIEEIKNVLSKLREDEIKAEEISSRLKNTIVKVRVNLRKGNLPGLPEHLHSGLVMAEEAIHDLELQLGKVPLDMNRIHHHVKEAKTQVESISQVAKTVIVHADKAEYYIQYANQYRRQNQEIRELVEEAESAFRLYQYKEAMELAEDALDIADKRWRERLQVDQEESAI